jgi:hypothetical protein
MDEGRGNQQNGKVQYCTVDLLIKVACFVKKIKLKKELI